MNPQQRAWETRRIVHGLSIHQPWAELIIRGVKVREFRSKRTHIRGRVYIYARQGANPNSQYLEFGLDRDLPTGVLIGTVEVVDCEELGERDFAYVLAKSRRLRFLLKPHKHAQPIWFRPFDNG